jgi:transcriptional regulator with XRE-family HTH domain
MLTGEQIRAARAFIGWSQADLAEKARCSLSTISQIEKLARDASLETLTNIERAFEKEGMFFTENGLTKRNSAMYELTGDGWTRHVLEDVYQSTLDQKGAEVLFICSDDRLSPPEVIGMLKKIRNAGVAMRHMVREGNTYLHGPVKEYRWIPTEYFQNCVVVIYADKICLCVENNTKAMIIRDPAQAKTFRNLFNLLWTKLEEPHASTAPERF